MAASKKPDMRSRRRHAEADVRSSSDEEVHVKVIRKRVLPIVEDEDDDDQSAKEDECVQAKIDSLLKGKEKSVLSERNSHKTQLKVSIRGNDPSTSKQQTSEVMGITRRPEILRKTTSLSEILKRADSAQTSRLVETAPEIGQTHKQIEGVRNSQSLGNGSNHALHPANVEKIICLPEALNLSQAVEQGNGSQRGAPSVRVDLSEVDEFRQRDLEEPEDNAVPISVEPGQNSFFERLGQDPKSGTTSQQGDGKSPPSLVKISCDDDSYSLAGYAEVSQEGPTFDSADDGVHSGGSSLKTLSLKTPKDTEDKLTDRVKCSLLSELSSKMDVILLNQARILSLLAPEEELLERPPNLPPTPLKSIDSFHTFEIFLEEPVNADALVTHLKLSVMNCPCERDATSKMLKLLISNNLSRALSWGGGANKEKFSASKLMNVIARVILKLFPKSKLDEARNKVQRWLETSNQRKPEDID